MAGDLSGSILPPLTTGPEQSRVNIASSTTTPLPNIAYVTTNSVGSTVTLFKTFSDDPLAGTGSIAVAPPSSTFATATASTTTSATPSASASSAPSSGSGLSTTTLIAILVPVIVILALVPIIYLLWLRSKAKRQRQTPELRLPPPETSLLNRSRENSLHSHQNSVTKPSPFSDSERIQNGSLGRFDSDRHQIGSLSLFDSDRHKTSSLGIFDFGRPMSERPISGRPSSELERVPSPTLPSPSVPTFRTQEAWPLPAEPIAPPVPPYDLYLEPLRSPRSPSSQYTTPQTAQFGEDVHAMSSSPAGSDPFRNNRNSDAISEMSFNPEAVVLRSTSGKDADEVSMISAMSPDEPEDRHFDHLH